LVEQRIAEESAEKRPGDAEDDGAEKSDRIAAGDEQTRDRTGDQAQDHHRDDERGHYLTLPWWSRQAYPHGPAVNRADCLNLPASNKRGSGLSAAAVAAPWPATRPAADELVPRAGHTGPRRMTCWTCSEYPSGGVPDGHDPADHLGRRPRRR